MRNYVIIGGSSGIGRELALQIAGAGGRVFATYCKSKPENSLHPNISFHHMNVLDETVEIDYLPDHINGLAYCPGSIKLKPFKRLAPADFISDYELQLVGAVKVIQMLYPRLAESELPSIVLFSTVAAQLGFNFHSLVGSSKGAVEGLMRSLAAEFAPAIRVNAIAPSLTDTPLSEALLNTDSKREANALRHPMKRIGKAGDIASMAHFLLSEQSAWISGQVIHVDGGISSLKV